MVKVMNNVISCEKTDGKHQRVRAESVKGDDLIMVFMACGPLTLLHFTDLINR